MADPQSKSYSSWTIGESGVQAVYTIASREVTRLPAARLDQNLAAVLQAHLAATITLGTEAGRCRAQASELQRAREGYLRVAMRWLCQPGAASMQLSIQALLDVAPSHIHFARIRVQHQARMERLFTRHQRQHQISLGEASTHQPNAGAGATILTYTRFGFEHILIGLDHIAFLLTLMLLAQRLRDIIFIVSGFTVGHSLTLSLSVLGLATPNSIVVEALIGFTIAMVAIENVSVRHGYQQRAASVLLACLGTLALAAAFSGIGPPAISLLGLALFGGCYLKISSSEARARQLRPAVTTLFGLIHGFGFAAVLLEVGLPESAVVPALFGFNIGVELGQIAIVLGLAAIGKFSLKLFQWHDRGLYDWANAALCGLGTFWFIQRLYF
ncbi:MAG: HupE/UreJ family protein [Gammaproteobacteria bacterium]|nr:HupE/UreJ family protein [Gammaproteobacteria bacterium]